MKRITHWPQAVLGLAFNWGALLGWAAVSGAVAWPAALPLYAGGALWTLVYDTVYAHQDKADDARVGIRSTALLFGAHTRPVLGAFAVGTTSLVAVAGVANGQGALFFAGTALAGAQLARVVWRTDFEDRRSCWKGFVACGTVGLLIWAGALADYAWMRVQRQDEECEQSAAKSRPRLS
jgi:4-hydroxybenzoate polyprenyltransferase